MKGHFFVRTHHLEKDGNKLTIVSRMITGKVVCYHYTPKDGQPQVLTQAQVDFMLKPL